MTGGVKIVYSVYETKDGEKGYAALLWWGPEKGWQDYVRGDGPTWEIARARAIAKFKEIPPPETLNIE